MNDSNRTKIGIIILNYETYEDTIRLVTDLQKQKGNILLEIVVVDNDSPNNSYNTLKEKLCKYTNTIVVKSNQNEGYAKGNNFGLKVLEQQPPNYVVIMNNDIYIDNNLLLISLVDRYNRLPDVGFIAPLQYDNNGKVAFFPSYSIPDFKHDFFINFLLYRILKKKQEPLANYAINVHQVEIIPGSFMFIKFDLFKDIDFFYPNTFLFGEERFLAKKIKNKQKKNYIITDLNYVHKHSTTISKYLNRYRQNKFLHESKIKFTSKYRKYPELKCFLLNIGYFLGYIESIVHHWLFKIYTKFFKK